MDCNRVLSSIMGYTINHTRTTRIIPICIPTKLSRSCRAKHITEALQNGAWKGKRCFIIGGGPSLENFNFSVLKDELTIGVNKAFVIYNSTINYGMDFGFYSSLTDPSRKNPKEVKLRQQWLCYKGVKLFLREDVKIKFDPSVYYIDSLKKKSISYDISKGIYGGNNSGFGALMLAIALGANPIGLLGFDLKVDKEKNKTHWHEGYPHQNIHELPGKLKLFAKCFEEFAPSLVQGKVDVVNIDLNSALLCFPKKSINDFLREKL